MSKPESGAKRMSKKVRFEVSVKRAFYNNEYHHEWKVFRVEKLGGGLIAKRCVADVYGPRRLAVEIATSLDLIYGG